MKRVPLSRESSQVGVRLHLRQQDRGTRALLRQCYPTPKQRALPTPMTSNRHF
jgi:hypothetical protein